MTDQLKAFLIAIPCIFLLICIAAYDQAEPAAATPKTATLSPEQQTRKQIKGITELNQGQTTDQQEIIQLTIQYHLIGIRSPKTELLHRAAEHIEALQQIHPRTDLIDLQYNIKTTNAYGETSYQPALRVEITKQSAQRIQWDTFNPNNLPKIATVDLLHTL